MNFEQAMNDLPVEWGESFLAEIHKHHQISDKTVVVLDDDPTGNQTIYDVPIITHGTIDDIEKEFSKKTPLFFILTNSRSLPENEAVLLTKQLEQNLRIASENTQRKYTLISRGDSTLRGHYPAEVDALENSSNTKEKAIHVLIPAFFEGGRYTINDVHYVKEGVELVPAAKTPFALDSCFGFKSSNLKEWIIEKTKGAIQAKDITSISIETLRQKGPGEVFNVLSKINPGSAVIVNAASYRDLEVFTMGLLKAEQIGKKFICRTAASFVPVRAGLPIKQALLPSELKTKSQAGGVIVVGSYVPKSSSQLKNLLHEVPCISIEVNINDLLDDLKQKEEIERVSSLMNFHLKQKQDVVIYTGRKIIQGKDDDSNFYIGKRISDSLVSVVTKLEIQPSYFISKGGITSHDLAVKALNVRRAMVIGQAIPGIPVWKLGEESRFNGLLYIVFPGNVGAEKSLTELVKKIKQ